MKKWLKKNRFAILLFFVALLLGITAIINGGVFGDDSPFHKANTSALITTENNFGLFFKEPIRPFIARNLGYGVGMFYPQLAHMLLYYIVRIGLNFNMTVSFATSIYTVLILFLSGYFFYHFMRKITNNKTTALVTGIIYMTMPYILNNFYSRSALGEVLIFPLLPLVFLSIYYLFKENNKMKFYTLFVGSFTLIVYAHFASLLYTALFLGIFLLCFGRELFKRKYIIPLLIGTGFVILLSLPGIIPMLEARNLTDYMVFVEGHMGDANFVANAGHSLLSLFNMSSGLALYLPFWFFPFLIYFFIKKNKKETFGKLGFIVILLLSLIMVTRYFPWRMLPNVLQLIQFPWRLEIYFLFAMTILLGYGIEKLDINKKKIAYISLLLLASASTVYFFSNKQFAPSKAPDYGVSYNGMGWQREYLPKKAYDNQDYFESRTDKVLVTKGEAKLKVNRKGLTNILISTSEVSSKSTIELPLLYYPGYKVTKNLKDNTEEISYQESENGFIEIELTEDSNLEITYQGTYIQNLSSKIAFITIPLFLMFIYYQKKRL